MKSRVLNNRRPYLIASGALAIACTYTVMSSPVVANTTAAYAQSQQQASHLAMQVLQSTEQALMSLEKNHEDSLTKIEAALQDIASIEQLYPENTKAFTQPSGKTVTATRHEHYLPRLSEDIFKINSELPTLQSKLQSGILYSGQTSQQQVAYFDFSFAKASLITAREAIRVDNSEKSLQSLKWVFEAVYIAPDFDIATQ